MPSSTHIGLIGGSRLLREALAKRFQTVPGIAVDVLVEDVEAAIDLCPTADSDVWFVLMENLRENELEALILELPTNARIICIGREFFDTSTVMDAAINGRIQWLEAESSFEVMLAALQRPVTIERTCSPQVLATLAKQIEYWRRSLPSDQKCSSCLLTKRERQIAGLAAGGLINKQIARQLGIGITTVKSHLNSAMGKLQVRRRGDLQRTLGHSLTSRSGASRSV